MTVLQTPAQTTPTTRPSRGSAVALLVEPSACATAGILHPLEMQGYEVRVASDPAEAADAALVIVEADRGARTVALVKQMHALYPGLPIVGVLPWWNDDEAEIARAARFILHVPVRDDQVRALAELAGSILRQPALLAV